MKSISIEEIMSDFHPSETAPETELKKGAMVGIWLPAEDKARYDHLQEISGRKFSKKIREVIQAVLDHVEKSA